MLGDVGAEVVLEGMRLDHYLFSESGARMLISFAPSALAEVEAMASAEKVYLSVIGKVGGESIVIRKEEPDPKSDEQRIEIQVREVARIYQEASAWVDEKSK